MVPTFCKERYRHRLSPRERESTADFADFFRSEFTLDESVAR
jgi:hypothetical protein